MAIHLPLDCIPCFLRGALDAARHATSDETLQGEILQEALHLASQNASLPAPWFSQHLHRILRERTGVADPYREAKQVFNALAMRLLPHFRAEVARASDPLEYAVRLSVAANLIDLGVYRSLSEEQITQALYRTLDEPFVGDFAAFRQAIESHADILYLADNAGEIVFDRLLIELLPPGSVTVAVRGRPVLNDATRDDALLTGIDSVAHIIDNGSDAPGTLLTDCSPSFQKAFSQSGIIIAKGQGNFETLRHTPKNIFFLLKIKCTVVAAETALPIGTLAMLVPGWQSSVQEPLTERMLKLQ